MGGKTITFDRLKLSRLKKRYGIAREKKEESFRFEGSEFVTDYAKYLIEYLENKFGKNHQNQHVR